MEEIKALLHHVPIPQLMSVRQKFHGPSIEDVASEVTRAIVDSGELESIQPQARIAIGVGSRGIVHLPIIVKQVVTLIRERGATPFIVPAMGSHAGATAEGQTEMLRHLGVTPESVGAPIHATMEVVRVATSDKGLPLWIDKFASEADGVIVINRIKPHTSFHGAVESGLLKMLVIGLGKQRGADSAHAKGFGQMAEHIVDISKGLIQHLPVKFGLGILENAYDETAKIVAVPAKDMYKREQELLQEARLLMPKILVNNLHVLIVDEIGKDISGVGMDPNVTGRFPNELVHGELRVNRVVVLRLTRKSDGNAAGIGLADVTTQSVEENIDRAKVYMNSLTSTSMASPKIPMVLPSDRLAIQAAVKTCFETDVTKLRVVRIKNTLSLEQIWVSEPLRHEVDSREDMQILGYSHALQFDNDGNLSDL